MENILQAAPLIEKLLNYGAATLCTVALLAGIAWHFWKLKPTLDAQSQLIFNNTVATQALSDMSKMSMDVMSRVSDKLIAHDERALSIHQHLALFTEGINTLKSTVATHDSISRLHLRIDDVSDKSDVALINKKIDDLKDDTKDIATQINKIAGKIGV